MGDASAVFLTDLKRSSKLAAIGWTSGPSLHCKRTAWRQLDYQEPQLWWHHNVPSHKVVMDWKMSPSHNLGTQFEGVWLNQ